ncbi:fructokinase [Pontibacillus halophilus JSM 076056 = DSM 19796]|uniref:Fructokinase n=1 Tax=Pontibacillus halophilus JSM 076056 = DSM 19796 TaxID=1385510 RepID=A0A0A5GRJ7_9BACI|nr:aminoimidazole riboside kinase [Pontibacillus halophilus]KGX93795.1 fructokinase [Pontibacillus halophilus JSM 076056 = DSM 19796]
MTKKGVISLGEALIDFIPLDEQNMNYQKSPGGAPANVAVGLARLGAKSTFLGKVGEDVLGRFLQTTLQDYGVKTDGMIFSKDVRTGVVFVTLGEGGERSFDFYINPSADQFLQVDEVEESLFKENKVLHFGSISMINEPVKSATAQAVQLAKENGMVVSYDPNLRLNLWPSEEQARETIISMLDQVHVLKISEEELEFITGESDIDAGIEKMAPYNIPFMLVTLGGEGSYVVTRDGKAKVDAMKVKAIDTTGAGDAFVSGVLHSINEFEGTIEGMTVEEAKEMAQFGAVSGALAAATKGAMTALPTASQVESYLK